MSERECVECKKLLELSEFYSQIHSVNSKKYYHRKCKSCCRTASSRNWPLNKESNYLHHIKREYGLTPDDYYKLIAECSNCCSICGIPSDIENKKRLCVDHDHETGKVRGLLCKECNKVLGLIGDSIPVANSIVSYLKKFQNK